MGTMKTLGIHTNDAHPLTMNRTPLLPIRPKKPAFGSKAPDTP